MLQACIIYIDIELLIEVINGRYVQQSDSEQVL